MFPKAERALLRAIELDNRLGEAYATLGGLRLQQGDRVAAETAFKRAIKLNPNYALTYNWYSLLINSKGEPERALEMLTKGLELDPRSIVLRSNLGYNYSEGGSIRQKSGDV